VLPLLTRTLRSSHPATFFPPPPLLFSAPFTHLLHCLIFLSFLGFFSFVVIVAAIRHSVTVEMIGCLGHLIGMLGSSNVSQKNLALSTISLMCCAEEVRILIREAEGIPIIISLLNGDDEHQKQQILSLISRLADEDEENAAAIVAAGGLNQLIKLLTGPTIALQVDAMSSLEVLTRNILAVPKGVESDAGAFSHYYEEEDSGNNNVSPYGDNVAAELIGKGGIQQVGEQKKEEEQRRRKRRREERRRTKNKDFPLLLPSLLMLPS
jgi:hypothetical protein